MTRVVVEKDLAKVVGNDQEQHNQKHSPRVTISATLWTAENTLEISALARHVGAQHLWETPARASYCRSLNLWEYPLPERQWDVDDS